MSCETSYNVRNCVSSSETVMRALCAGGRGCACRVGVVVVGCAGVGVVGRVGTGVVGRAFSLSPSV